MYFPTAVALAALPFLAGAVSVQNSLRDVVSIPLSKRSAFHNTDGLVDIAGLQADIRHAGAKYRRGFEAFEKSTGKRHPLASRLEHSDKRSTTKHKSVPLSHLNLNWYAAISIGAPPQNFTILLDTGSADLILPGPNCTSCQGHEIYDPSRSLTATDLKQNLSSLHSFLSGEFNGSLFTDSVLMGKFNAINQTLAVTSEMSYDLNYRVFGVDAILGLGFKSLSLFADPFFQTLVNEHRVQKSVFGLSLAGSDPMLILGGRDSNRYKGKLVCVAIDTPQDTPGLWQTRLDNIAVNGKEIPLVVNNTDKIAIIDSGITQVIGDHDSIVNFYNQIPHSVPIPGGQFWSIPCNATVNASIYFGGTAFHISSKTFSLGPLPPDYTSCLGAFAAAPSPSVWTIGSVFLQNVYTEFDVGNRQVCFAPLK